MRVFVDTSALYALLDGDDSNHEGAVSFWEQLLGNGTGMVTNNYVLLETCALLQNRIGVAALRAFQQDVAPLLTTHWVDEQDHRSAVEAALAAGKRKLSVVDCASFHTMRQHGLYAVFCFDLHFREQGFEIVPLG